MKVSLLSNVNVDYINSQLKRDYEMCPSIGYGNLYGKLLDKNSVNNTFGAQINIIIIDVEELIGYRFDEAKKYIDEFFDVLSNIILPDVTYVISDVDFRGHDAFVCVDSFEIRSLEHYWCERLYELMHMNKNVYKLEYKRACEKIGKNKFYSDKMWYMGKIILSVEANRVIYEEIKNVISNILYSAKKVLILDMDNTLWGGVVGEDGYDGIKLSDDHEGAIYKDFQRIILRMKQLGVLICIASKNNEEDVKRVIEEHPHMLIRNEDIVCKKINWINKDINIREIAKELNLGLDSMVFVDDSDIERELVKQSIPEIEVPDFPKELEKLPEFMEGVYCKFFRKLRMTNEDRNKTELYKQNEKRSKLESSCLDFDDFLVKLDIKAKRVDNVNNSERIHQLINKSNQFNLTTKRMTMNEIYEAVNSRNDIVYAFEISDKFGNNGLVGILMIRLEKNEAYIENFVMSCRVMGRKIENYLIDYVENDLKNKGIKKIFGIYVPTQKNVPVKELYKCLGYTIVSECEGRQLYELDLCANKPKREHFVKEKDYE